jgi:mRNA interferase MazF
VETEVKRGDVFWVNFEPSLGGEIKKKRPAVVISTDRANLYLNRVVVVPLSSKTATLYPSEARILLQGSEIKAMADQIRTVSKERLISKMGSLPLEEMRKVEQVLKSFLELI